MELSSRILELSRKYCEYTVDNLSQMIQIPSYSGQEEAICARIVQMCKASGFDEVRIDGLGSVVGRVGKGKKKLAFDAHIDTVEVGDITQWNMDPFSGKVTDGLVYGLGSSDQLGGAASMITAGRILKELEYDGDFSCYFTFTVMEEDCDGIAWLYLIEKEGFKPDYVVSTEPTACRLYRGQRGRMEIEIELKGVSAHGSIPEQGDSAAYKASNAALAMEKLNHDLLPEEEHFLGKGSVTVSRMEAYGPSQCSVPDRAVLYLDRRLTWGENADIAIDQVIDYIFRATGEKPERVYVPYYRKPSYTKEHFEQELYFPTWKISEDHHLVKAVQSSYGELFGDILLPGPCSYSTNAVAFCGRYQIPSIIIGPGDVEACHRPNETTRVEDLAKCSALYALLPYFLK